ncbi:MAG TPA: hypothetical protein VGQ28_05730, partial [Thermoanaerobaculia bacterium]|nr:hypothetical protein [Thermoanaerobaculia bacterium]
MAFNTPFCHSTFSFHFTCGSASTVRAPHYCAGPGTSDLLPINFTSSNSSGQFVVVYGLDLCPLGFVPCDVRNTSPHSFRCLPPLLQIFDPAG